MNDFSIFVSSSDNYSDIWDLFFDMFQKFWPEFQGKIYLQTETKDYRHDGLNIVCTKVGKHRFFGETLRAGLAKVKEDNILLFCHKFRCHLLSGLYAVRRKVLRQHTR